MPASDDLIAPSYLWVPEHVTSEGTEAIDLAESLGFVLDPEQRLAVEAILSTAASGKWAAFEAALIGPRQNIKTFVFKVIALADLFLLKTRLIVWTAHLASVSELAFRDLQEIVDGTPDLSRRVKAIHTQNGEEGIELTSGQRLEFKARTKTGGRGLTSDRLILDEAFALTPGHVGSLMPTMAALSITGNPQIIYGSSGGLRTSKALRDIRDRGRPGGDPSLVYIEWGAEPEPGERCEQRDCDHAYGIEGCMLDDEARWARANPALGRRISYEFLRMERRAMGPVEFAREVLTWWDDPPAGGSEWEVITEEAWSAAFTDLEDEDLDEWLADVDRIRWSLDVSPDSRSGAIAISDGRDGELIDYRSGTEWMVPRLLELKAVHGIDEVYLDERGPAGAVIQALDKAGIKHRHVALTEHAQACAGLLAAVDATPPAFRHIGQEPLDLAVACAVRRSVTDVWLWTRAKSTGDIAPLVAITLARWAALTGSDSPYDVLDSVL